MFRLVIVASLPRDERRGLLRSGRLPWAGLLASAAASAALYWAATINLARRDF